jgi:DNA polymerase beta
MNDNIISQFKLLIKLIQFDIDNTTNKKEKQIHGFRLQNIKKALKTIEEYPSEIKNENDLKGIPGIGKGTLARINEILTTGKLAEIKEDIINDKYLKYVDELVEVYGIGRKTAVELFKKYNVKSISELKQLYEEKKIDLSENIIKGLKYYGKFKENIPRQEIDLIYDYLRKVMMDIDPRLLCVICGSYRRLRATSNDIDMIIVHPDFQNEKSNIKINYLSVVVNKLHKNKFIVDSFTSYDTETKFMGLCQLSSKYDLRRIDIRFIAYESYYYAILYFTGSKDFNKKMRQVAIDMGYKLNEYGLYDKNNKIIKVNSEKEIFDLLNMEYIQPDQR